MDPIKKILVISNHAQILETILRLIHKNTAWQASGALSLETALAEKGPFDVVLLGSGLSETEENQLFAHFNTTSVCIKHYGGGSGLLYTEILQALEQSK